MEFTPLTSNDVEQVKIRYENALCEANRCLEEKRLSLAVLEYGKAVAFEKILRDIGYDVNETARHQEEFLLKVFAERDREEFDCEIDENILRDKENAYDSWGDIQYVKGTVGAEYNYCIQDDGTNASAVYKMSYNELDGTWETDYSTFLHHEIDVTSSTWKEDILAVMREVSQIPSQERVLKPRKSL